MTTQTESLKLALDEIKRVKEICLREVGIGLCNEIVIAKLEEALAQEKALQALHDENERLGLYKDAYAGPEQEPVGYFNANSDGKWEQSDSNDGVPFYAALPPQPKEPAVSETHKQKPAIFLKEWSDWRDMVVVNIMRHGSIDKHLARELSNHFQSMTPQPKEPEQEPTNDWSEWRGMVVQNLMRHGIDKDFARRLAHFYQDKAPQPKEPEQEPLEYWNAVEGWVKIDEVREHFDSVGCATIYKTAGEGRVPLSLCKAQPEQEPVAWASMLPNESIGVVTWSKSTAETWASMGHTIKEMSFTTPPQLKEPEQEPVAWMFEFPDKRLAPKFDSAPHGGNWQPLYKGKNT